jgi:uncharacterized ParB-like nuclease family protein
MNINKIIDIIHTLKEEGMGVGAVSGPTNSLAGGKIAGTAEAGDSPPVDLRTKNTKNWNIFFKGIVRRNRKKQKKKRNK